MIISVSLLLSYSYAHILRKPRSGVSVDAGHRLRGTSNIVVTVDGYNSVPLPVLMAACALGGNSCNQAGITAPCSLYEAVIVKDPVCATVPPGINYVVIATKQQVVFDNYIAEYCVGEVKRERGGYVFEI